MQYAGLKPLYVDIDPHTYNLDPKLLDGIPAGDVAAVVVQHTYGIPAAMQPIAAWASSRGLPIIEDCCHTFGARAEGRLCGTFGAFAFMSGQWNKFFSTGLGGMLLVREPALADRVAEILRAEATSPGRWRNLQLGAQILAYRLLARPGLVPRVTEWYRRLNRMGLVVGSSSPTETVTCEMPPGYLSALAPCQVRQGLKGLAEIEENIRRRTELTAWYRQELPRLGFAVSPAVDPAGMPLLRFPLRVANKSETLVLGRQARGGDRLVVRVALAPRGDAPGGVWLPRWDVSPGGGRRGDDDQSSHPSQSRPARGRTDAGVSASIRQAPGIAKVGKRQ